MEPRRTTSTVIGLLVGLAAMMLAETAAAQQLFPQPPYMPPGRQSVVGGRFYFQGGVQYRNIQTFSITSTPRQVRYLVPGFGEGLAPFGPENPTGAPPTSNYEGDFGGPVPGYPNDPPARPTGNAADTPNTSGIWNYDNGAIDPNYTDNTTLLPGIWPDSPFSGPATVAGLGRYATVSGDPQDVGSFRIVNPAEQVDGGFNPDDPPLFTETDSISFTRTLFSSATAEGGQESRILIAYSTDLPEVNYTEKIFWPTFELGYQYSNFFDFFYGLSWYQLGETTSRNYTVEAQPYRTAFTDTYSFYSDNADVNWTTGRFSSTTTVGDEENVNQYIFPDASGPAGFPSRTFFDNRVASTSAFPSETWVETLVFRSDIDVYENRFGARSWVPLYGLGKLGVSTGLLVIPMHHRTQAHTSYAVQLGAAPLAEDVDQKYGWVLAFGGFGAIDLALARNGYFLRTNIQYNIAEQKAFEALQIEANLNVSGFSSMLVAGMEF